jgi:hypothetical protein
LATHPGAFFSGKKNFKEKIGLKSNHLKKATTNTQERKKN